MTDSADSERTYEPVETSRRSRRPIPGLTLLFHPDPSRVGHRALLGDLLRARSVSVSRAEPEFCAPGEERGEPLGDRHLSRKPVRLGWDRKGRLVVSAEETSMRVVAGQRVVEKGLAFDAADLEDGVVLEIAERVVLLVHLLQPALEESRSLGLVGANAAIDELRHNLLRVADLPVSVLIRGETGTGKELVARAIHDASARADKPYIAVNMAAIPESTAASELFGHARGAFTGAVGDHRGYFGDAEGGTLFLDEIGATPAAIQPMLLRVLESQEIQPLGSANPRKVDVRIVAATDADLEQSTAEDSFRAALLHRLEGYQLFLPPLRKRRDDIGRLLLHFLRLELEAIDEAHHLVRAERGEPTWVPASLVSRLANLAWPGNVRQLRNFVRQLVISSRGYTEARIDSAVERMLAAAAADTSEPIPAAPAQTPQRGPAEVSDDEIIEALRAHDWQANKAASAIGISRSAVYKRMKESERIRFANDLGADEIRACSDRLHGDVPVIARELEVSERSLKLRMKELGLD